MNGQEGLEFNISFAMSGSGLDQANRGLVAFKGELKQGQRLMAEFEQGGLRMKATIGSMGDELRNTGNHAHFAKSALAGLAVGMAGVIKGMHALSGFGDMANQAFGERASSIRAYTALLGNAKQAQTEYGKAQMTAMKTPFLSTQFEAAQQQLMVAGLRNEGGKAGGSLDKGLMGIADLASLMGDKNMALQSGAHAYAEIAGKGHLGERQLQMLNQDVGLSPKMVYAELNRAFGGHKSTEQIEKMISKRQINSDVGLDAIQRAILKQLNEKRLGQTATSGGGSLTTMLVNQGEQWKNALKVFDSDKIDGVRNYKRALQEQGDLFDLNTKKGRDMSRMLQDMASTSDNVKSAWTDFETSFLESFSGGYAEELKRLGISAKDGIEPIKDLARELGRLGPIVADALHKIIPAASGAARVALDAGASTLDRDKQILDTIRKGGIRGIWEADKLILKGGKDLVHGEYTAQAAWQRERDNYFRNLGKDFDTAEGGSDPGGGAPLKLGGDYGITIKDKFKHAVEQHGSGKNKGWVVPWARDGVLGGGIPGPVQLFGTNLAEQARQQMEKAEKADPGGATDQQPIAIHVSNIFNIDGSKSAAEISQMVQDKTEQTIRAIFHRLQRGPSPKRG